MFIYAGIDEAGYGPLFGPLVIGKAVLAIPNLDSNAPAPDLWQRLSKAVCKNLKGRNGRIAVNDSKKLTGGKYKLKHLETGCLTFSRTLDAASLNINQAQTRFTGDYLNNWLSWLDEDSHNNLNNLPWYQPSPQFTWQQLPVQTTEGELSIAGSMLKRTCERIGVHTISLAAKVITEDKFNQYIAKNYSKAAVSFTSIAAYLQDIWRNLSNHNPTIIVDRQGGRTHYLRLLIDIFPSTNIKILQEDDYKSSYKISSNGRSMTLHFQVNADGEHLPTALASMLAKYTRELLMMRFNNYFTSHIPEISPTAGYATDGKRFWQEIQPHLKTLNIPPDSLRRMA